MENILQKLDIIVKDNFASFALCCPFSRGGISYKKKSIDNQQVSLPTQVVKCSKFVNVQHVLKIVELDDFDIEKTKVAERQPLKCFKITLLSLEASKKRKKKLVQLKFMKKITQPIQRKIVINLLDQKTSRKIQLQIMLSKNVMYL
jgi:hypothetical protein